MIPPITDSMIRKGIQTEAMVRNGLSYWQQGRVTKLEIDVELGTINAKVKGSAQHPYDVLIIFSEDDDDVVFELDCSCPVGFGCKHCAAVLYAARAELTVNLELFPQERSAPPRATAAPLSQPLINWLADAQAYSPVAWLTKRIHDFHGDLSGGTLRGLGGSNWLDQAIATNRLHWRKPNGPLLHMAETKQATFHWVTLGAGEQRLTLADVPAGLTLIALAPPLLIDEESGAVHRLACGVEMMLAERLLHLPPVPLHAVSGLAENWSRVAGDAVPPPALPNMIDRGMMTPAPVLTFREEGVEIFLPQRSRYYGAGTAKTPMATARLSFDYDGYPVTNATVETQILHVTGEGAIQFQRDLAAEKTAFARMASLGLMPVRTFHEAKAKAAQAWDLLICLGAVPADYADILQSDVPRLQAEGWRIDYAPRWSLAFVEIEPESLSFDVAPSGLDWFDLSLGARIDGKTIDILPILRRLLALHGEDLLDHPGETLSFEVAPGKLAQVPMERIKPVLEMLLLFALQDRYGNERLRLPARDLAALADFESETSAHIPWTGAEPLRALAKALAQLELDPTKTPKSFLATLRPYQQQGLDWLQALHRAGFGGVLADDMGLDKTVQTLAHMTTLAAR